MTTENVSSPPAEVPLHQDAEMKIFRDRIETASGIYLMSSIDGVEWMKQPIDTTTAVEDLRQSIGLAALGAALTNSPGWWFLGAMLTTGISRSLRKGGLYLLLRGQRVLIATGNETMVGGMARTVLLAMQHARANGG